MKLQATIFLTMISLALPVAAATHTWSGNGFNDLLSNAANWSSGGVPAAGEISPVILHFPANSGSPTPLDDIASLAVDTITFDGGGYNLRGTNSVSLSFRRQSVGATAIACTNSGASSNKIESTLPLVLVSITSVTTDNVLNLDSPISGGGGLATQGGVWLRGTAANTYSATTTAFSGTLHLAKSAGVNCFAGDLIANGGTIRNEADHQIPDASSVTLKTGGFWVTNARHESIGALHFDSGTLQGTAATPISLLGDIDCTALGGAITGGVNFGGAARIITVSASGDLHMDAVISNASGNSDGLKKLGQGALHLAGANLFSGDTVISEGICVVENELALGNSTGFTAVAGGGVLLFLAGTPLNVVGETLYLVGSCTVSSSVTWSGAIVLNGLDAAFGGIATGSGPATFTHTGVMSGVGMLNKTGASRLILGGNVSNTYTGGTRLLSGEMELNKSIALAIPGSLRIDSGKLTLTAHEQIADTTAVVMNGGIFDLGAYHETIGSLAGAGGEVQIAFGNLTTGGSASSSFSGLLSGVGSPAISKTGNGFFILNNQTNGGNTLTGTIVVDQGTLYVDGTHAGPITVNSGGTLTGAGSINNAVSVAGGKLELGSLHTGNLELGGAGAQLVVPLQIGSANHASVNGTITLTGCSLNATLAFSPPAGTSFTLIENDGVDAVSGTFQGLPEGATGFLNNMPYTISYVGGTGNDVVLQFAGSAVPTPSISQITVVPVPGSNPPQFEIALVGTGTPNALHRVQISNDLILWQDSPDTVTSDAMGHLSVSFTENSLPRHFYRLAFP